MNSEHVCPKVSIHTIDSFICTRRAISTNTRGDGALAGKRLRHRGLETDTLYGVHPWMHTSKTGA